MGRASLVHPHLELQQTQRRDLAPRAHFGRSGSILGRLSFHHMQRVLVVGRERSEIEAHLPFQRCCLIPPAVDETEEQQVEHHDIVAFRPLLHSPCDDKFQEVDFLRVAPIKQLAGDDDRSLLRRKADLPRPLLPVARAVVLGSIEKLIEDGPLRDLKRPHPRPAVRLGPGHALESRRMVPIGHVVVHRVVLRLSPGSLPVTLEQFDRPRDRRLL
mmetsp:Transcript_19387/g.46864  ORF Transcript_19387/g.46864 Transcript_19387/m.46864 type:complete len:215 (+) Transcript_19387:249-893(+)